MKLIRSFVICFVLSSGLVLGTVAPPVRAQSAAVVVTIQNYAFVPATVTVTAGTTIVWSNQDSVTHTPTSDTGVWDVPTIAGGQRSNGIQFNTPGAYPYHCAIHPDMIGTIIVQAAGSGATATPTPPAPPSATTTPLVIAPSTSTPVATLGSTATVGTTPTVPPTPTSTPLRLVVKLAIGHTAVRVGAKQSIKVTTLAGAAINIVVTFPDGAQKHRSATSPARGTYTWTFKQPGGHTTRTNHTAKVTVTVSPDAGSPRRASKKYVITKARTRRATRGGM